MIAVDTNILVYSHRTEMPFHAEAKLAVRGLCEGTSLWALPWPCVHEFLAIVTHRRVFSTPTPMEKALDQVRIWCSSGSSRLLGELPLHLRVLSDVLSTSKVAGPRVHDARIASLCLSHGVSELWSADRDFSRFTALRVRNPLVTGS